MLTGDANEIAKWPGTKETFEKFNYFDFFKLDKNIDPFLLKGSLCTSGKCEALVLAVG